MDHRNFYFGLNKKNMRRFPDFISPRLTVDIMGSTLMYLKVESIKYFRVHRTLKT